MRSGSLIESLMTSPLFAPILPGLSLFSSCDVPPTVGELNSSLKAAGVCFVPQTAKSNNFADSYEPRIFLRGEVQTREHNWHDFFNALVWHRFPKAKKAVNALQYELQKSRFPDKNRLPAENMLTLFDENGAIVVARDPELIELIREHKWRELFWDRRAQIEKELKVLVFGHAMYEKAMRPYIGLTAQALLFVDVDLENVDSFLAEWLTSKSFNLQTNDLDPLPVLGMPGWWPANHDQSFYNNPQYFRS